MRARRIASLGALLCSGRALLGCSAQPDAAQLQVVDAAQDSDAAGAHVEADAEMDAAPGAEQGAQVDLDATSMAEVAPTPGDAGAQEAAASGVELDSDAGMASQALRTTLVIPELWTQCAADRDPFEDRPPSPSCPGSAVAPEVLGGEPALSVDTGACNYLTVTQPALFAVAAGETLKVRLWHFELSAAEPAEAHAALRVNGLSVLDERVPIPQPGGLITRKIVVPDAIPAGTPIYFHLHNHGTNFWALVEVSSGP